MTNLVRAEWVKIRSLRSTWILALCAIVFCVFWTLLAVLVFKSPDRLASTYQMAQQSYLFLMIFGILGMTGEYRHQTVTWAFLVAPVRVHVLAAKAVAYTFVGLAIAVLSAAATTITAVVTLQQPVFDANVPIILLGSIASNTLYTLLGLAIGALVRNQIVAVSVAFGWFYYAEYLLVYFVPAVGKWMPSGAAKAVIGWHLPGVDLLPQWAGIALFVGYVGVIALLASLTTLRRDVT
jgi:ABC-2 type transport system permease protein